MREAMATAEVGDEQEREDPDRPRARAADGGAARPGGGRLPADRDDGQPDRARDSRRARHRAGRRGERAHPGARARRRGVPLRAADARLPRPAGPADARSRSARRWSPTAASTRRARRSSRSRTPTTRPGGTVWPLDELHEVVVTVPRARALGAPRRRAAAQRRRRARRAAGGDRGAVRHRHDLPLEGPRLPARRPDRGLARADAPGAGREAPLRRRDAPGRASSPRPGSTRSTTTSSGWPTTTSAPAASPWRGRSGACRSTSSACRRTSSRSTSRPSGSASTRRWTRLREAGVLLSRTMRPGVLRAVTHLDVDDDDIDGAIELVPRALGSRRCPRLTALAPTLERIVAERQADRLPSVAGGGRPQGRARLVRRGRDAPTTPRIAPATPDDAVPHRLDHQDVHRDRDHAAPRRRGARPRRPARAAHPRDRERHADASGACSATSRACSARRGRCS